MDKGGRKVPRPHTGQVLALKVKPSVLGLTIKSLLTSPADVSLFHVSNDR